MPEYLAPGVFVEELDVGIRPIEGVSTSTGGMVGVTERGAVNVPWLVTSYPDYQRMFGGPLPHATYGDAAFLPHAVEGFFQNGGQRLNVTRIVADELANLAANAEVTLFDRGAGSGFDDTRLLRHAREGDALVLAESTNGLVDGDRLRLDDGRRTEYATQDGAVIAAADRVVALRLPLVQGYAAGDTAAEVTLAPVANPNDFSGPLDGDHAAGTRTLILGAPPDNVTPGAWLQLGAGDDAEYVEVEAVPVEPAGPRVTLRFPLARDHGDATAVVLVEETGVVDTQGLVATAEAGDGLLILVDVGALAAVVRVRDAADPTRQEYHALASFHPMGLVRPSGVAHPSGEAVTALGFTAPAAVDPHDDPLDAAASAGDRTLLLNDVGPLAAGDFVRIGDGDTAEFGVLDAVEDQTITLRQGLASARPEGETVTKVDRAPEETTHLVQAVNAGATTLFLADATVNATNFDADQLVEIGDPDSPRVEYRVLENPSLGLVALADPLVEDHSRGALFGRRDPLLRVQALDPGPWGNELRVLADDDSLLTTTASADAQAGDPVPLTSVAGVEVGTVLEFAFPDPEPARRAKVTAIDANSVELAPDGAPFNVDGGTVVRSLEFRLRVEWVKDGRVTADENLRSLSLDHRHSRYVETVVGRIDGPLRPSDRRPEGQSDFIRVDDLATPEESETLIRVGPDILREATAFGTLRIAGRRLEDGADPPAGITADTYIGTDNVDPDLRTGLQTMRNESRISLVAIPGRTEPEIQQALIEHCERQRYRFAILDSVPGADRVRGAAITVVRDQRNLYESRYAALYYPWLVVPDPFPADPRNPGDFQLPPSGHMMGIYARTDATRGVHKAPANELIRGVSGLQRKLNQSEQEILNPSPTNINVLRDFRENGRGLRVWGARCVTSDTDWKYVPVRRLFLFLEQSLEEGTQWVVFEPNDEPLWARVHQSISAFLTRVWRDGALQGTTAEEAFFVRVDRTTMTQDDIDNGRLIVLIGVAPVKPAEFVILRIFQHTQEAASA